METIPITIIGGGVVGCAIAYELSKELGDKVLLIERNQSLKGENQSSRNSGVIHAGIYYPKDTMPLKARLCVEGNRLLYEFCHEHEIPHKRTGKLVVATNSLESEYLDDVLRTAVENNVPKVRKVTGSEARVMEPNVSAEEALYAPTSGVIDATSLVGKLHALAEENGAMFATDRRVCAVRSSKNGFTITMRTSTGAETFQTKQVINAAGLYSDDVARMVNPESIYQMDPIRGESAKFYAVRPGISMRGMNVYPAPHGILPNGDKLEANFTEFQRLLSEGKVTKTVGIHLTPTFDFVNGEYVVGTTVTIGPAAVGKIGKEDYRQTRPESYYLECVRRFFPNLKLEDIRLHQAGIRAKLHGHPDFVIERDAKHPNCINLIGIDSPGLTSSLAIAKYVGNMVDESK